MPHSPQPPDQLEQISGRGSGPESGDSDVLMGGESLPSRLTAVHGAGVGVGTGVSISIFPGPSLHRAFCGEQLGIQRWREHPGPWPCSECLYLLVALKIVASSAFM